MKKPIALFIALLFAGCALTGCIALTPIGGEPARGENAAPAPSHAPPVQTTEPAAAKQLPSLIPDEDAQEGDDGNYLYTDQAKFCGYWHASPSVGSGYSARYLLDVDGTFIYGCDEMDSLERMRYCSGNWYIEGNKLCLEIWERVVWEGGKEVPADGSAATSRMIDNPVVKHIGYDDPEPETHEIAEAEPDEETGKRVIMIGGVAFYSFDEQTDLMGGFWEMIDLAE